MKYVVGFFVGWFCCAIPVGCMAMRDRFPGGEHDVYKVTLDAEAKYEWQLLYNADGTFVRVRNRERFDIIRKLMLEAANSH